VKTATIYEITTAHPRDDIRIYHKYCKSLENDLMVELLVQDENGDHKYSENLLVKDLKRKSKFGMFGKYYQILKYLKEQDKKHNSLLHLHDPELMPLSILLGILGYKVVFDFHEDYVKQLDSKPYLRVWQKTFFRILFRPLMYLTCKTAKLTIGVTPDLVSKLNRYKNNSMLVENYPLLSEAIVHSKAQSKQFVYAGNISEIRGIYEMLDFLLVLKGDYKLILCGKFRNEVLEKSVKEHDGWKHVDYRGVVDRQTLKSIFSQSLAGLIFFQKVPNNLDSRPNKFYEYMEASLPIIASDIPSWKTFIDKNECGVTLATDSLGSKEELEALLGGETVLKQLGDNGRAFIENNYSWQYKYEFVKEKLKSIL